jgi:hypothetical protein
VGRSLLVYYVCGIGLGAVERERWVVCVSVRERARMASSLVVGKGRGLEVEVLRFEISEGAALVGWPGLGWMQRVRDAQWVR